MIHQLDRLASAIFEGMVAPEKMPDAVAALASWLEPPAEQSTARLPGAVPPPYCPHGGGESSRATGCRRFRPRPRLAEDDETDCAVCTLADSRPLDWHRLFEFMLHCRASRHFSDQATSLGQASHITALVLDATGMVLDCDARGLALLRAGDVLSLSGGALHCADGACQEAFSAALTVTATTGRAGNLLVFSRSKPLRRFSLCLSRLAPPAASAGKNVPAAAGGRVLCLVAPLDGRRIATARQLMALFGLSAAEARLARAICLGDTVEDYARNQGLHRSTVRTQLSAVLHKTGTARQAGLVRLIAGIPVVRDLV